MTTTISKELSSELIDDDASIAPFLNENFDAVKYAAKEIKESSEACADGVALALDHLASSVQTLERRLHSQITARHDDLLAQASGVEKLELILDSIKSRIHSLKTALERVQSRITEPYKTVEHKTLQLTRLQQACDYLRRIIHLQKNCKQLRSQIQIIENHDDYNNPPSQLTKTAQNLSELLHVEANVDLDGIEIIQDDRKFIEDARIKVKAYTEKLLDTAILQTNPSNIAIALSVFYFLGELDLAVLQAYNKTINNHKKEVRNLLELSNLEATFRKNRANLRNEMGGRSDKQNSSRFSSLTGGSNKPTGIALRNVLWKNFAQVQDKTFSAIDQILSLHKCLLNKRNLYTHELYINNCTEKSLTTLVWRTTLIHIQDALVLLAKKSNDCRMYLESEYPRLYQHFFELWDRCSKDRDNQFAFNYTPKQTKKSSSKNLINRFAGTGNQASKNFKIDDSDDEEFDGFSGKNKAKLYNGMNEVKALFSSFETAYLARSLSRMFDLVENVFSGEDKKNKWNVTENDLENLVHTMMEELEVSAVDLSLAKLVSKNIVKTIKKITLMAEDDMCRGKEAIQVVNPPNYEQITNCSIINTIWRFYWKCDLQFNDLKRLGSLGGLGFGMIHGSGASDISDAVASLAQNHQDWLPDIVNNLDEMMELINIAITPLLSEIAKNIEAIILTMHDEDNQKNINVNQSEINCPWSNELKTFIARIVKEHFTTLVCKQAIMERLKGLSRRAVVQATSNVLLVKKQNNNGSAVAKSEESEMRNNLIRGLNELEVALAPLITSPGGLLTVADCSFLLKQTKPLLMSSPEVTLKKILEIESFKNSNSTDSSNSKQVTDLKISQNVTNWNNYMLSIWQRSDSNLFNYSPTGKLGYVSHQNRLNNSHKMVVIENYHKFINQENRSESEILLLHRYGLENYESNFKGDSFDDVYDLLCQGVKKFGEILEVDAKSQ